MSKGPSPEAIERLNKVLVLLYSQDRPLIREEIKDLLSDPMSHNDIRSALRRLHGSGMVEFAPLGEVGPWRYRLTSHGKRVAQLRIVEGVGY